MDRMLTFEQHQGNGRYSQAREYSGMGKVLQHLARRVVLGYGEPAEAKHLVQQPLPMNVPAIPRHRGRPRTTPAATGRQRGRPRKRG